MSAQCDIVYLSRVLWDSIYQRPQRLAAGLAERFRVLYVDTPRSTFHRRFVKPLLARHAVRPFLWQPSPGLTVLSPGYVPFLPKYWPPPGQYALSCLFVRWAIGRMGITRPVLWADDPRDLYFLKRLASRLVCYDCMDDYALIAPSVGLRPALRAQEISLLRRADLVFASGRDLALRCSQSNPHTLLVANGVDAARFSPELTITEAEDLAAIPHPRLGYVGSIAPWLDVPLLAAVASSHPRWSIVLVGPVARGFDAALATLRLPNVHIVGERPYQSIPAYLRGFDVCLIPFQIDELTRSVNPVKFFEYLAAGRPVVATPLPELQPFADVCALASESAAFAAAIECALASTGDLALIQSRLAVARANSWQQRVDTIAGALQDATQAM